MANIPFSFTGHAKDIYTQNREQLREKIDLARLVITCTGYNKVYLDQLAADSATPIHRVYHGINLSLFKNKSTRPAPSRPYQILTVARLTDKKGIDTVLQALSLLEKKGINFCYTLIGDGDKRDLVMEKIFALGLEDKCRWLGVLPHERVIEELKQADLFVLGCRVSKNGDRDGIPNVLVESLAMGLPAVGTTVSGLPEIIHDQETGLLVETDSPEKLAKAIRRMLTDNALRKRCMQKGLDLTASDFDNKKLIRELAEIYLDAIPALTTG